MKVLGYVNKFNRGIYNVQTELLENANGEAIFDFDKITVFGATVNNALELLLAKLNIDRKDFYVNYVENETNIVAENIVDTLNVPLNVPLNEPLNVPLNVPLNEPLNVPLNEPINEPINEPVNEPVNEPINEPINEPVNEPVNEPLNEPINDTLNDTLIDTLNDTLNERQKSILKMILQNKHITNEIISKELKITLLTSKREMAKLVENKIIQRIGSRKNGHWVVIARKLIE